MPEISFPPWTLGAIIAMVVLILTLILMIIGQLPILVGGLFTALALARLT